MTAFREPTVIPPHVILTDDAIVKGSGAEANPSTRLVGSGGTIYGTTLGGGPTDTGTIFSLSPPGSAGGSWTETEIYGFSGSSDGAYPNAVGIGSGGILYGTTENGGNTICTGGCGTVFSLSPPASSGGS